MLSFYYAHTWDSLFRSLAFCCSCIPCIAWSPCSVPTYARHYYASAYFNAIRPSPPPERIRVRAATTSVHVDRGGRGRAQAIGWADTTESGERGRGWSDVTDGLPGSGRDAHRAPARAGCWLLLGSPSIHRRRRVGGQRDAPADVLFDSLPFLLPSHLPSLLLPSAARRQPWVPTSRKLWVRPRSLSLPRVPRVVLRRPVCIEEA